ncbi:MAG: 16S rRNA (cytidine(1402)-2'-O)-methyltransferase [Spirochaetia bacterium]|nr:16S rRNA (cytidine(1402)-2'-O)-methyltransferase [Spirochaetota bacterium]MCX8096456.1 16S rRNA (cytidine(1402)-2'-O)-methyltransferase [Spirochaetota bacterium]MDW8112740.1 16S rRNA (cytidine(1402)-2'-O)-methyltransferase [Spirochaetia bacterium]
MKKIYIVSTPIGNLEDITIRALDILKKVDVIVCENPKHHLKLLNHYGIRGKRLIKITSANEANSVNGILKLIEDGKEVAIVSDAGTPGLSDPGSILVRELTKRGVKCIPIPGPSALTSAISVSPIPMSKFIFYGFIPKSQKKVEKVVQDLSKYGFPVIFFIPPERVKTFVNVVCSKYPHSEIVLFREITKLNEEVIYGNPCNLEFEDKGEFVVVVKF